MVDSKSLTQNEVRNKVKLPALQFYVGDWKKDLGVQALGYEERGIWIELLFLMHESERRGYFQLNGKAVPDEMTSKILRIHGNKWKKVKRKLEETNIVSFEPDTGIMFNRRMVRDEEKREKSKENGKLGGNPNFQKGKPNPYYDNRIDNRKDNPRITPSFSSSSSSSSSIPKSVCVPRREPEQNDVIKTHTHLGNSNPFFEDPKTEEEKFAEALLEKPDGNKPWEKTNAFLLSNRRPTKDFPSIMLSRPDVVEIIKTYKSSGIAHKLSEANHIIAAKLDNLKENHQNPEKVCLLNWYIGWVRQQILEGVINEKRLSKIGT